MSFKMTDKVTWVGKIDWGLRKFHGDEYSTHRGSSYNSFLIKDEKTVLIDTVWEPFAEVFKSKALLVGSSTVNKSIMSGTSGLLDMMKGLGFKKKKAAAFGSYGWSGEYVDMITERLKDAKMDLVNDGIKELWNPDDDSMDNCIEFGREFAKQL